MKRNYKAEITKRAGEIIDPRLEEQKLYEDAAKEKPTPFQPVNPNNKVLGPSGVEGMKLKNLQKQIRI